MTPQIAIASLSVVIVIEALAIVAHWLVIRVLIGFLKEAKARGLGRWCHNCRTWHWHFAVELDSNLKREDRP